MLNTESVQRLNRIRDNSIEQMYGNFRNGHNPEDIVEKIKSYQRFEKGITPSEIITYLALRKAVSFGEKLETADPKFIYNAGMERIKLYTDNIVEPLGITQRDITDTFKKQYNKFLKN